MISHKKRFIFIHINKCGGTSIKKVLSKYGGEYIFEPQQVWGTKIRIHALAKQYSTTEYWKQYFKFSVVRNPWEKELSDYFFCKRKGKPSAAGSFIDYLNQHVEFQKVFHHNQLDWLVSKNMEMELDFIGRFENLREDFDIACDKIGIPRQELPHVNASNHHHYAEYYDDDTREIVAKRYEKDIEYFGYEFGGQE